MSAQRFAVALVCLALAGCGDTKSGGGTAASTTRPGAVTTVPTTGLQTKLLTVSDLPSGWELGSPINDQDLADSVQAPCSQVDPSVAARLKALTGVQFQPSDGSPKHLIEFVSTGEPTQLAADVDAYLTAARSCASVASTAPGGVTVGVLALPEVGDQRGGFTYRLGESGGTWYGHSAMVRVGSDVVSIGLTEILKSADQQPTISDQDFVKVLSAAVAKFTG